MHKKQYIAISGNIGSGKSTLVQFLATNYGIKPYFEPFADNPYLVDFYKDMHRYAFQSQVYFLTHKFRIHQKIDQMQHSVVLDRTLYEDAEIFARSLYESRKMEKRDYDLYMELYDGIKNAIRPPDLMIYLNCSVRALRRRIKLRGRKMEQDMPLSYLKRLQGHYTEWIGGYKASEILVLDTDKLDYIEDIVHRIDVMKKIERYL